MLTINDVTRRSAGLTYFIGLLVSAMLGCGDLSSDGGGGTGGTGSGAGGVGGSRAECESAEDCDDAGPCVEPVCENGVCTSSSTADCTPCEDGVCLKGACETQTTGTVALMSALTDFNPSGPAPPVEGVEVCESGTDNCVFTDERGRSVLVLPRCEEVVITMNKEGYAPYAISGVADESFTAVAGGSFFTDEQMEEAASQLGLPYPWNGGVVALATFPPIPGTTFTSVDASCTEFYFDADSSTYSTAAEGTAAAPGLADLPLGAGGCAELPPGVHEFEFGGAATECERGRFSLPSDAPNTIRVPILDGYVTWASMSCE